MFRKHEHISMAVVRTDDSSSRDINRGRKCDVCVFVFTFGPQRTARKFTYEYPLVGYQSVLIVALFYRHRSVANV